MKKLFKSLIFGVIAVIMVAVGIKASDLVLGPGETEPGVCPPDMTKVLSPGGDFCMDIYEASAGSSCNFANPGNHNETITNVDNPKCLPVSVAGAVPWRNLTQNEAVLACARAGKRLPTNKEWQAGALATPDRNSGWTSADCQVYNNWPQQPGLTGSGADCRSSAGAYDMIGNVWEWVADTIHNGTVGGVNLPESGYVLSVDDNGFPSEIQSSPDPSHFNDYFWIRNTDVRSVSRGGYWENKSDAGQYALYAVSVPSFTGTGVGFRCVK